MSRCGSTAKSECMVSNGLRRDGSIHVKTVGHSKLPRTLLGRRHAVGGRGSKTLHEQILLRLHHVGRASLGTTVPNGGSVKHGGKLSVGNIDNKNIGIVEVVDSTKKDAGAGAVGNVSDVLEASFASGILVSTVFMVLNQ